MNKYLLKKKKYYIFKIYKNAFNVKNHVLFLNIEGSRVQQARFALSKHNIHIKSIKLNLFKNRFLNKKLNNIFKGNIYYIILNKKSLLNDLFIINKLPYVIPFLFLSANKLINYTYLKNLLKYYNKIPLLEDSIAKQYFFKKIFYYTKKKNLFFINYTSYYFICLLKYYGYTKSTN